VSGEKTNHILFSKAIKNPENLKIDPKIKPDAVKIEQ
jgi:3-deoxy-D-arabino-heptulosonate 7-phosphate (DAHP) synthase class II